MDKKTFVQHAVLALLSNPKVTNSDNYDDIVTHMGWIEAADNIADALGDCGYLDRCTD